MTTVQDVKQLFDRKLNECRTLGLSEQFCRKKIRNSDDPTLKDRFMILAEKKCLLQKKDEKDYNKCIDDVLEEAIGEEAIDERQWIPMSTKFPNLKGVTNKDMEDYIFQQVINEAPFFDRESLKFLVDEVRNKNLIPEGTSELEEKEIARKYYLEQYFKRYKLYDRDEIFTDSQELFGKLKALIREKENIQKSKYGKMDKLESELDHNTIYVTSPRGGHEFLSIFAYANDIDKSSFPSDIIGTGDTARSTTWLGDKTDAINRIVFIDDIIASGDQTVDAIKKIEEVFGMDIPIYFISLCKRTFPSYWEGDSLEKKLTEHSITIHDTLGIKGFDGAIQRGVLDFGGNENKPVSCAFTWSIPDGLSDRHIIDLYQQVGITAKASKRSIGTPRKTAEKRKRTIEIVTPPRRFWHGLDLLSEEEKKRFVEYLFDQPEYTGYWIDEPILESDEQTVWFRPNAMDSATKKLYEGQIQRWQDSKMSAIDLNLLTHQKWGGIRVDGQDDSWLKAFGYQRDRKGLLEKKEHYYWNEKRWRMKKTMKEPKFVDSPITEKNANLIKLFQPIMQSGMGTHEKYDYIDLARQLQERPDLIKRLLDVEDELKLEELLLKTLHEEFPIEEKV